MAYTGIPQHNKSISLRFSSENDRGNKTGWGWFFYSLIVHMSLNAFGGMGVPLSKT